MNAKVEKARNKLEDVESKVAQWRAKQLALDKRKDAFCTDQRCCPLEESKAELEERGWQDLAKIELEMRSCSNSEKDTLKKNYDANR